jgi:hypothetical protein
LNRPLCHQVNSQWLKLLELTESTSLDFGPVRSPLDILVVAARYQSLSPSRLILVAKMLWATWTDKNQFVFQQVMRQTPLQIVVRQTLLKIEALGKQTFKESKLQSLLADRTHLDKILASLQQPVATVSMATSGP